MGILLSRKSTRNLRELLGQSESSLFLMPKIISLPVCDSTKNCTPDLWSMLRIHINFSPTFFHLIFMQITQQYQYPLNIPQSMLSRSQYFSHSYLHFLVHLPYNVQFFYVVIGTSVLCRHSSWVWIFYSYFIHYALETIWRRARSAFVCRVSWFSEFILVDAIYYLKGAEYLWKVSI